MTHDDSSGVAGTMTYSGMEGVPSLGNLFDTKVDSCKNTEELE